jgi:DNA polymerase-3 subunit beta
VAQAKPKLSFTVKVDDLLEAALKAKAVVPASGEKPTLVNMLLLTRNGVLEVLGSDLQVTVRHRVPSAVIASEGTLMLHGGRFTDLLKMFKGTTATISAVSSGCRFQAPPDGDYQILGGDPRDYPELTVFDGLSGIKIKGKDLTDMIDRTQFAVSQNANKQSTHGIFFEVKQGRFRLVATDMKRLSITERAVVTPPDYTMSVVVPVACAKMLSKVITKDLNEVELEVGATANALWVRMPNGTASAAIVDSKFVPYESALSVKLQQQIDCDRAAFRTALQRARYVDDYMAVFAFEPGKLTLHSRLKDVGMGTVEVPVPYAGPSIKIGFNPKYIDEALEVVNGDKFRLCFENHLKAGIVRELEEKDGTLVERADFLYLTMPITLPGEHLNQEDDEA